MPATEIAKLIDNIKPKSDWERLFLPYMSESINIQELIDELRNLRNKVSHCKFFGNTDYQRCLELLEILNIEIDNALKAIMKIDFQELNIQEFYTSMKTINSVIKQTFSGITDKIAELKSLLLVDKFTDILNVAKSIIPLDTLPKHSPLKRQIRKYKNIKCNKYCRKNKEN